MIPQRCFVHARTSMMRCGCLVRVAVADVEVIAALGLVGVLPGHDDAVAARAAVAGVVAVGLGDDERGAGLELGEPPGAAGHGDRDDLGDRAAALGERVEDRLDGRTQLGADVVRQAILHAVLAGVLVAVAVVGDAIAVVVVAVAVAGARPGEVRGAVVGFIV